MYDNFIIFLHCKYMCMCIRTNSAIACTDTNILIRVARIYRVICFNGGSCRFIIYYINYCTCGTNTTWCKYVNANKYTVYDIRPSCEPSL